MIKDTMERDMINEISALFVMIFTAGLMFVMPMLDIECDDITIIIGSGIILSFILTIIPILLSYDIRDEIIIQGGIPLSASPSRITSILTLSPAKSLISSLLKPFHFTASIAIGFFTYLFIILRFNILLSFDIPFYKIY